MAKKQPTDRFLIFIRIMDLITWVLIFAAMIFFNQAQPEVSTILDQRYDKVVRTSWIASDLNMTFILFIAAACVSFIGTIINLGFIGDHKHHLSFGLVTGFVISLGGVFLYLIHLF